MINFRKLFYVVVLFVATIILMIAKQKKYGKPKDPRTWHDNVHGILGIILVYLAIVE